MDPLYRPDEACPFLRCSKSTLYRLIRRGSLPVVRVGADIRIAPADLEAWVESQKVGAK
jgi:excisionase family DNA binding protein